SLGVFHHKRPKKHFHWMLVSGRFNSQICWVDYQEVYGGCPDDAELVFKLYNPNEKNKLEEKIFLKRDLPLSGVLKLTSIFDANSINEDFSYVSIWCSYGGLAFYSTLEKKASITIEHSF
ncbi:MAG: hypothetical protein Q8K02_12920, partial [Flavobacterium sp.]|nr:hypothetical protein [Flavobacterium sp.]